MAKKPTLNIAQMIHILYQIENLTGYTADELLDIFMGGNVSNDLKQLFLDTFTRIKNQPLDVGMNAALYLLIYKMIKKAATGSKLSGSIDMGFFYLKPI